MVKLFITHWILIIRLLSLLSNSKTITHPVDQVSLGVDLSLSSPEALWWGWHSSHFKVTVLEATPLRCLPSVHHDFHALRRCRKICPLLSVLSCKRRKDCTCVHIRQWLGVPGGMWRHREYTVSPTGSPTAARTPPTHIVSQITCVMVQSLDLSHISVG